MNSKSALLVIDMQNVYLPQNDWACKNIYEKIQNIEKRISQFPRNNVFFTKYLATKSPQGQWCDYNKIYAHINSNPYLNDYIDDLKQYVTDDNSFEKSTFSSLSNNRLFDKLNEFSAIYVTGVIAECCVLSTVFSLIDMGKKVIYCSDAIAGKNPETENAVITILKELSPLHIIIK